MNNRGWARWAPWAGVLALAGQAVWAAEPPLRACRLEGVSVEAQCGHVRRPLDPASPQGVAIDIHFAVVPALARNKKPDPLVMFAGGPGQSAIALAGPMSRLFARVLNRRDLVLIDQRGTGRSAPLACDTDNPGRPLRDADMAAQHRELQACLRRLQQLPHGDLRHYTTAVAMADAEAVRELLGAPVVNLVGGSYGTRAALEYLRQYPQRVRRVILDGVAPPDMVLPATFSADAQSSLDALLDACDQDPACQGAHGPARARWQRLLASLPRTVTVQHPLSGQPETFTMTHERLSSLVRLPLYAPALAAGLPHALAEAEQGRFGPLVGLATSLGGRNPKALQLAMGMHLSVVCSEDMPRLQMSSEKAGADFGDVAKQFYSQACQAWPRGSVPEAFYGVPVSPVPVLVLSGGADPVTPPRHGQRVAGALGSRARHIVVQQAGHGVMALPCMRDVLFRFLDAATEAEAMAVDAACASGIPRPLAFRPVQPAASASAGTEGSR